MSIYKTTWCPHCGASIEAFHGTNWEKMETQVGVERDHCPSCRQPYDLERLEWQEWSTSGRLKSQLRGVSGLLVSALVIVLFVVAASGFLAPKGFFGVPREVCGLALLVLFPFAGLFVFWRRLARPDGMSFANLLSKDGPANEMETARRYEPEVPRWDTSPPGDGVRGMPTTRPSGRRVPCAVAAATPLEELAKRIASAFLLPGTDPQLMERLRVLSETTCQWPPMRPAEADRKLGKLTMTGGDDTRAYVTIREDGRGHLSLLRPDGLERVVRFEYALKHRRSRSERVHIRKSSPR